MTFHTNDLALIAIAVGIFLIFFFGVNVTE
jgi:hypothetical protein